jgi:uncharacterized repeat protein (TIGR03803 family)
MSTVRLALSAGSILLMFAISVFPARAQIVEGVVQTFTGVGGTAPGTSPSGTLITNPSGITDSSGYLYGTTLQGGTFNAGVVFKLDASIGYAETVLHSFTGNSAGDGDGGFPTAGLVMDRAGNLYGTTTCGGDGACNGSGVGGDGIIYELPAAGGYIVLYRFSGGRDGSRPWAPLIQVGANLYGTTTHGGAGDCSDGLGIGCGTAFKFATTSNHETVLYRFTGGADGGVPYAPLVQDTLGRFDGTTSTGGKFNWGTVFRLATASTGTIMESVLYHFTGGSDGGDPIAGLSMDSANNLYGTATCGGIVGALCPGGNGVVFQLSSAGFQTLHTFTGTPDGADPVAGVVLDAAANLCGTTYAGGGGTPPMGTLFTLTKSSGYLTELSYDFGSAGTGDGANPLTGLTFGQPANKACPGTPPESRPPGKGTCTYVCGTAKNGGTGAKGIVFGAQ